MITQIDISGFRSIKDQQIPLKKFNILYGPNGSGKSSVMYAPYVMRNLFVNPNQRLNSLFNLGFINLGGYENVLANNTPHYKPIKVSIHIDLEITGEAPSLLQSYTKRKDNIFISTLILNNFLNNENILSFNFGEVDCKINIDLPSSLTEKKEIEIANDKYLWNGLTFEQVSIPPANKYMPEILNSAFETTKNIEVISVKRGFFSPIFSTEQATDESIFAMQIRDEGTNFEGKIDRYFKQLFNKTFRFVAIPGSTSFYLRTQNAKGFTTDLVNEGFGVNQTVYMLIRLLKKKTGLAFIEEPEIHLHPTAQGKLVDVFTEIIKNEGKQIFLTTHSENIVSSVLSKIANGELNKDEVRFYLATNENDETKIIPQEVNDKGQIEGGLMNFMETELSNLKSLLGV
jgi:hypothetical protein